MLHYSFCKPGHLIEALQVLSEYGGRARIAAGCSNLLPDLKARHLQDCLLVDISELEGLRGIQAEGDWATVGSLTTIAELAVSPLLREGAPLLWQACQSFGDPLVRNRATLGGNLGHASPAADTAPPLLAMEASVATESLSGGRREFPIAELFAGPGRTNLRPGELILSLRFPLFQGKHEAFVKFGLRDAMAISLASAALSLRLHDGLMQDVRLAYGSLAATPFRATRTEECLTGMPFNEETLSLASAQAQGEVRPITDVRASSSYRRQLAGALLRQAARAALS
ncbi:MAG: xanthine dehydrogenase family protein subunit M [Coprothermobacterota bacterium]|nr:xanthine dehydrogenase family protein subunit M [Coprothermobacterota bacterium]